MEMKLLEKKIDLLGMQLGDEKRGRREKKGEMHTIGVEVG